MDIPKIFNISECNHAIHNPITSDKLSVLGKSLRLVQGMNILDIGCGSGELLCTWARDHGIIGTGIDMSRLFIENANRRAIELSVQSQVKFKHDDAKNYTSQVKVDIACCIGATWIAGGLAATIELLENNLSEKNDGIILIGEPFWKVLPSNEDTAKGCLANSISDYFELPELIGYFNKLNYDVVEMVIADNDSWDRYEAAKWITMRKWLKENEKDEMKSEVIARLKNEPLRYVTYTRKYLGWGIFALMKRIQNE